MSLTFQMMKGYQMHGGTFLLRLTLPTSHAG